MNKIMINKIKLYPYNVICVHLTENNNWDYLHPPIGTERKKNKIGQNSQKKLFKRFNKLNDELYKSIVKKVETNQFCALHFIGISHSVYKIQTL